MGFRREVEKRYKQVMRPAGKSQLRPVSAPNARSPTRIVQATVVQPASPDERPQSGGSEVVCADAETNRALAPFEHSTVIAASQSPTAPKRPRPPIVNRANNARDRSGAQHWVRR